MPKAALTADSLEEQRVYAFQHQRAEHDRHQQNSDTRRNGNQLQSRNVHRQHRTKQQMQQIDATAVFADQNHADGKAAQIKCGKVRVFFQ